MPQNNDQFVRRYNQNMTTTLTETNQVTVPEEIVKQMGLKPGAKLEWTPGNIAGTFVVDMVQSKRQLLDRVRELGKKLDKRILDDLIEARVREE